MGRLVLYALAVIAALASAAGAAFGQSVSIEADAQPLNEAVGEAVGESAPGAEITEIDVALVDISALTTILSAVRALDAEAQPEAAAAIEASAPASPESAPAAFPWYRQFTVNAPAGGASVWGEEAAAVEFRIAGGERWGFTLGFNENRSGPQFELEDLSAGAFLDVSDRLRLRTGLRFTAPETDVFGEEADESEPELKFESALRF